MFKHYFTKYQSPSNMCKKLSNPKSTANEFQLKSIKEELARLKKIKLRKKIKITKKIKLQKIIT